MKNDSSELTNNFPKKKNQGFLVFYHQFVYNTKVDEKQTVVKKIFTQIKKEEVKSI